MRLYRLLYLLILFLLIPTESLAYKRALLIGVSNYPKESGWCKLASCNDIALLKETLSEINDITCLVDENATKKGIDSALKKMIRVAQQGDTILVHFSGHGQQMLTSDPLEDDNLDEAFIPYDAQKEKSKKYVGQNHLTDNELSYYIGFLREKVGSNGLVIITLDACHSGNMDRATSDDKKKYVIRGTSDIFGVDSEELNDSLLTTSKDDTSRIEKNNLADVLYLSACGQHEVNREITINGVNYGSLSYCISKAYGDSDFSNIVAFKGAVKSNMREKMPFQTPQLRTSLELSLDADSLGLPLIPPVHEEKSKSFFTWTLIFAFVLISIIWVLWKRMR